MSNQKTGPMSTGKVHGSHKAVRRYTSQALFHDAQEILIEHAGQEYRLRITRHDKLILTK